MEHMDNKWQRPFADWRPPNSGTPHSIQTKHRPVGQRRQPATRLEHYLPRLGPQQPIHAVAAWDNRHQVDISCFFSWYYCPGCFSALFSSGFFNRINVRGSRRPASK